MLRAFLPLRFILLVAALGAAIGALALFWVGASKIVQSLYVILVLGDSKVGVAGIMSATDAFLFGIVLVVFAFGVSFGFVFEIPEGDQERMPRWSRVRNISDLKQRLIEIIILYLIVDFATDWVDGDPARDWGMLIKPISIVLIA